MFEFLDAHDHEDGSADRYDARPRRRFWWLVHLAHPLIGFLPCSWAFRFHDWTSHKINVVHPDGTRRPLA